MSAYVPYLRQSTQKQALSGLGIEAQRELVDRYVAQVGGTLVCEPYIETESGKRSDRAELAKAMEMLRARSIQTTSVSLL